MKQNQEVMGASATQTGLSQAEPEVSALRASIPSAWPLCAYAPGNYYGRCHHCGEEFEGDKRAFECLECAVRSAKFIMERGKRIEAAAIDLHDTITLWVEYGGPALPEAVEKTRRELAEILRDSEE